MKIDELSVMQTDHAVGEIVSTDAPDVELRNDSGVRRQH